MTLAEAKSFLTTTSAAVPSGDNWCAITAATGANDAWYTKQDYVQCVLQRQVAPTLDNLDLMTRPSGLAVSVMKHATPPQIGESIRRRQV